MFPCPDLSKKGTWGEKVIKIRDEEIDCYLCKQTKAEAGKDTEKSLAKVKAH